MKNKLLKILALIVTVVILSCIGFACEKCEHDWQAANCTNAKYCLICGKTRGEELGHNWKFATCTEPRVCLVCGEIRGEPLGHTEVIDWGYPADCFNHGLSDGMHCSVCNMVFIEQHATGYSHTFVNGVCSICGAGEVTSIEITQLAYLDTVVDYKIGTREDGSQYKYFSQITTKEEVLAFDLRYIIGPDDATDKTIMYSFDPENPNIKVENGRLVFSKPKSGRPIVAATITLTPKENNSISDSVYISVRFN